MLTALTITLMLTVFFIELLAEDYFGAVLTLIILGLMY